ncbi:MAG: polysaccharide biosynthesis tyrosine autokinase [Eubacteriales bacterium]
MSISEVKKSTAQSEKDITLYFSDFWRGIVKFWWVGIVLAMLFGGIMFYNSYVRYKPMYKTTATFTVHTQNATLSGDGGMSAYSFYYDRTTADQLAIVFPYVLQSNILQERVCEDLGVSGMPASISVECVAGTNMVTITTSGRDPQAVYDVLISVIENYSYVTEYIIGPTKLVTISAPELPTEPYNSLSWQTTTLKGILLGLAIGVAWIVLYAVLRQTVRTKEDIRRELNQTCIGVLPQVTFKRYNRKIDTSILLTNPLVGNEFPESIRLLRGAVENGLKDGEKVVVVTSTAPGEGKSVLTLNLATMFAKNGGKVLVIDADLRNSGISQLLDGDTAKANETASGDKTTALYHIRNEAQLGIDILSFDTSEHQLQKILRTNTIQEIIDSLRSRYDLILIDTPPCGIISDAAIIAGAADAAVYVVRQDTVMTARIREGIHTLLSTDVRLMGCVLNGAVGGIGGYGHYYGYGGYQRYYRSGYSGKNASEHKNTSKEVNSR